MEIHESGGALNSKRRIIKKSLARQVAAEIEKMILMGKIKPGEHLLELQLSQEMDVSRGPVRDAFLLLESRGFVHNEPYKGASVIKMDETDIKELCSMRKLIETYAVKEALKRVDEEKLQQGWRLVSLMKKAYAADDIVEYIQLDFSFHQMLVDMAEHSLLKRLYSVMEGPIILFMSIDHRKFSKDATIKYLEEHELLLLAFEDKTHEPPAAIITKHINRWEEEILELI